MKKFWLKNLMIESIAFMVFGSFLVSRASAEDQQPFPNTTIAIHVGTGSNVGASNARVIPEGDIGIQVGKPVMGFTNYSYTAVQVSGVQGNPIQLQTEVLTGVASVRPLGEYVYYGPLGAAGVTKDALGTGMGAKFGGLVGYRFGKSQRIAAEGVVSGEYSSLPTPGKQRLTFSAFLGLRFGFNRK